MWLRSFYYVLPTVLIVQFFTFGICVEDSWFGNNQQFFCRCTDNKCLPDGTCADGARCLSEWFGPSCQYQNLVAVYTAKIQPYNALKLTTDDSVCNFNPSTTQIEVTWNVSYSFTFIWLYFNTRINKENLTTALQINNRSMELGHILILSDTTAEVRDPRITTLKQIRFSGDIYYQLCSIYVNGVAGTWFGSNQQFLCRCTDNKCLPNGTCADGASCLSEWFGPSCQYQNLVAVYTAKIQPNNALKFTTDDSQCNVNPSTTQIEVTWNVSYSFTFVWLYFNTPVNIKNLTAALLINDRSIDLRHILTLSKTAVEIRNPSISTFNNIKLTVEIYSQLCSIYVNGGRNLALKQSTSQDSYYDETRTSFNAIDGNRDPDWYTGTCISSVQKYEFHYWTVQFDQQYLVNRYVLFSRSDFPFRKFSPCCLDRLQRFVLKGRDARGQTVFIYPENGTVSQLIYTVTSEHLPVFNVTVELTYDILNFCEFETYGDSICPPGKFGLECNKDCRCRNDEPCFTDTGTCSSGCAAGYTGMGCQTPCSSGTWGISCNKSCSSHCAGDKSCEPIKGTCNSGCVDGYNGDKCDQGNKITGSCTHIIFSKRSEIR
ncbi:uncharacterized protein LOC131949173 isoform X2 [Physella acuta]|nr:uncharacterized protein LOC131949173 isoform X2 [Physella acuta]